MGIFWKNLASGMFIRACGKEGYALRSGLIKFFLKSGKISLDEEIGNLVESQLQNQANLRVLTSLP